MKLDYIIIAALLGAAGCAQKKAEDAATAPMRVAPAAQEADEVAEDEAPAPPGEAASVGGAAVCTSPECEDACKDAGDLAEACAAAFAAGCESDIPPDPAEYDCDWESASEKDKASKRESGSQATPRKIQIEKPAGDELMLKEGEKGGKKARTEDVFDNKDDEEEE